jgi:hypothetical protein
VNSLGSHGTIYEALCNRLSVELKFRLGYLFNNSAKGKKSTEGTCNIDVKKAENHLRFES